MELLSVKNLSFRYPKAERNALDGITFSMDSGDFVTLCGPSGCGKSTLLRHLKSVFTPHGTGNGEIRFAGTPLREIGERRQTAEIGFVGQSPENQIVTDKVWHELAFGLESLGAEQSVIRSRVAETASFFGIQTWFEKNVTELSGGQKQLLNLAAVMVLEPRILLLDEPTSQLDPIAAGEFLAAVARINRELGTTVLISEHRLEEVLEYSNRMLVMQEGRLLVYDAPKKAGLFLKDHAPALFLSMPVPMRIWAAVPDSGAECPWTVSGGRKWLEQYAQSHSLRSLSEEINADNDGETALKIKDVWFRYEKNGADVLQGTDIQIKYGELLAVLGGNGTGKSTLLSLVTGANRPYRGSILINGQSLEKADGLFDGLLGVLPQNPKALFTRKTVWADLQEIFDGKRIAKEEQEARIRAVLQLCGLAHKADSHPYDLSGGEQQRAALAKVLLLQPRILLLDEPTKGMDQAFKLRLALILQELLQKGTAIMMVSHDVEFCAAYADRCALLFNGTIVSENTPRVFFGENRFYTTAACRMSKTTIPGAVTAEDVIYACGGERAEWKTAPPVNRDSSPNTADQKQQACTATEPVCGKKRQLSRRTWCAALMLFLAIPVTIYIGVSYLGDQKYLFISLLILLEGMLPFFLMFEGRKPKARELVVLAVLCAVGVAGRSILYMLPQCKPVAALTIISGVAFGGEMGFLVGALTMLSSNILFGQGPWTPWQMFAMGLIGFLAGVLYRKGILRRSRIALCLFGFLSVLFIYGGLMNPASAIMAHAKMNRATLLSYYTVGLPMDLVHAASTVIFLFFLAEPMLEKLEHLKTKYGLVD